MKVTQVCSTCGSEDVKADAFATWNVEKQDWEVADTFTKGGWCNDCDGECSVYEKDIG